MTTATLTRRSVPVMSHAGQTLHLVSMKHAVNMLWREVAIAIEEEEDLYIGPFRVPKVLMLVKSIFPKWMFNGPQRCSREGVLRRDNYTCAYCSRTATTVDHVLPKCRGGKSTWDNLVASCYGCNRFKADRTPDEAGMTLPYTPAKPSW